MGSPSGGMELGRVLLTGRDIERAVEFDTDVVGLSVTERHGRFGSPFSRSASATTTSPSGESAPTRHRRRALSRRLRGRHAGGDRRRTRTPPRPRRRVSAADHGIDGTLHFATPTATASGSTSTPAPATTDAGAGTATRSIPPHRAEPGERGRDRSARPGPRRDVGRTARPSRASRTPPARYAPVPDDTGLRGARTHRSRAARDGASGSPPDSLLRGVEGDGRHVGDVEVGARGAIGREQHSAPFGPNRGRTWVPSWRAEPP